MKEKMKINYRGEFTLYNYLNAVLYLFMNMKLLDSLKYLCVIKENYANFCYSIFFDFNENV